MRIYLQYYKNKANVNVASGLVNGIIDRATDVEQLPYIGQKEQLLLERQQDFRYLIYKNYKIIYFINSDKARVDVVNVFDCRQNPTKMDEFDERTN